MAPALKRLLEQPEERRRLGPFQLVRQLGRGGFAPVWLARETYGGTEVRLAAVKLFTLDTASRASTDPASLRSREQRRRQIIDEARVLCQVEHPNVVRFYTLATDDSGAVMGVAMEHLTGTALDVRLGEGRPSLDDTLGIGASIASALSAVHRAGLVHRDVKPANILDSGGVPKLIDFGIAAAETVPGAKTEPTADAPPATAGRGPVVVDDVPLEVSAETRERLPGAFTLADDGAASGVVAVSGTVGYVDPECVRTGAGPTPASDLYALGVVLYECVAGRNPAALAEERGLDQNVIEGRLRPAPLASAAPDCPRALAELVDCLLSADPAARPRSAEWVAVELERIRGERAGQARELPPESVGPFRGLGRFEAEDRDVYFGRSKDVAAALELLRAHGTVALVGASGSGKSSLARAGIVPRVVGGALGRWPSAWDPVVVVPSADARSAILSALGGLADVELPVGATDDVEPSSVLAALADRVRRTGRGVLLVVDQLEELVTVSSPSSRAFCAKLVGAIGDVALAGVRAIVTVRRDLLDALLGVEGLGKSLVRGSMLVEPISDVAWNEVVDQALGAYGYALEDETLRRELMVDLEGTATAMPLVQFALTELWKKRDTKRREVTRAGLVAIGGIAGALERHADETLARLATSDPRAGQIARELLLSLTTPRGTRRTRGRRDVERDDALWTRTLGALEEARLVVRDADGVTIAHEALLGQWGRLRRWVAEAREDRVLAEEADRDAVRWQAANDATLLWKQRRLAAARDLERRATVEMTPLALAFLRTSRHAERRGRWIVAGLSAAALVALGWVGAGYVSAVRAGERAALEKAAVEEQKASLEQQKRKDLEQAQTELEKRQEQIDELLAELATANDDGTASDVRRQIREAEQGARSAQEKIARALPARKPPSADRATAEIAPPAAPAPTIKVQRED